MESWLPGGAPRIRIVIVTSETLDVGFAPNDSNDGNSIKTVSGRALRGSVTGLSPSAVSDAATVLIASVKMPAISCTLRSFDAKQLVDATQCH